MYRPSYYGLRLPDVNKDKRLGLKRTGMDHTVQLAKNTMHNDDVQVLSHAEGRTWKASDESEHSHQPWSVDAAVCNVMWIIQCQCCTSVALCVFCDIVHENVHTHVKSMEAKLFRIVRYNTNHVLCQLLPPEKEIHNNLPQQSHSHTLPSEDISLIRKNFLHRMLFRDIYLLFVLCYCIIFRSVISIISMHLLELYILCYIVRWCQGLRLPDLNNETTYLLTYFVQKQPSCWTYSIPLFLSKWLTFWLECFFSHSYLCGCVSFILYLF